MSSRKSKYLSGDILSDDCNLYRVSYFRRGAGCLVPCDENGKNVEGDLLDVTEEELDTNFVIVKEYVDPYALTEEQGRKLAEGMSKEYKQHGWSLD